MTVGPYATPHGSTACGALSSSQRGVKHPRGGGESKPLGPKKNTLGSKKNQLGLKKHFRTKKKQIRIKKKPFRIKKNRGRFRIKKNICFFLVPASGSKKNALGPKKKQPQHLQSTILSCLFFTSLARDTYVGGGWTYVGGVEAAPPPRPESCNFSFRGGAL